MMIDATSSIVGKKAFGQRDKFRARFGAPFYTAIVDNPDNHPAQAVLHGLDAAARLE